jgi:regulator of PEP synthase PpsR (kinase-PPPase family)
VAQDRNGRQRPAAAFIRETMSTKKIYVISDATGESALHILRAAVVQFDQSAAKTTVFHDINTTAALKKILDQARSNNALIAFTFVRKEMRDYANDYCGKNGMVHHDILGPLIASLSSYLGLEPLETPSLLRKVDERYFKRMDAFEYTLRHDDGRGAERLKEADVVIVGLSRTSKTPTSFYLAHEGYKVANVPIVPGIPLPEELFEIDQHKIACLTTDPEVLRKVRMVRRKHSGLSASYSDLKKIAAEVEYVWDLIRKHRNWKAVDTTNKSVEETAWEIIHHVIGDQQEG